MPRFPPSEFGGVVDEAEEEDGDDGEEGEEDDDDDGLLAFATDADANDDGPRLVLGDASFNSSSTSPAVGW